MIDEEDPIGACRGALNGCLLSLPIAALIVGIIIAIMWRH